MQPIRLQVGCWKRLRIRKDFGAMGIGRATVNNSDDYCLGWFPPTTLGYNARAASTALLLSWEHSSALATRAILKSFVP